MRVRILRVPPSASLEGFDLRPYRFKEGHYYQLGQRLATILIMWGYAEGVAPPDERSAAADRRGRD